MFTTPKDRQQSWRERQIHGTPLARVKSQNREIPRSRFRTTHAASIASLERVLVLSLVNNHLGFGVVPTTQVFAHRLAVFASRDFGAFAVLQSHIHYHWAWARSSTLRRDINYSPSDCFETYPFPPYLDALESIGERYHSQRGHIMTARRHGLTATYNRFHSPHEVSHDVATLRALHLEMDHAVAAAYGWTDFDLGHGFHQTKQGTRYTINEAARRTVLDRLLALNHERYSAEQAAALAAPRPKTKTRKRAPAQPDLF